MLILSTSVSFGQKLISGVYDSGLKLAYDCKTNILTGYFESYAGWDEETNNSRFSCLFYIEGIANDSLLKIATYYPEWKTKDIIEGTLEIINNRTVKIKLPNEHGGCWNVEHFTDEPAKFELEKSIAWTQIRYVDTEKTYFYSENSIKKKQKAYLVKNDLVYIDKIEGDWAYCTFYGKKKTIGWLKTIDLNRL